MLADHLTKERSGEQLYSIMKDTKFMAIAKFDTKQLTAKAIKDAAIDIPLADDEAILHVDVEALYEVIGQDQQSIISSVASNSEEEPAEQPRRLTFGRKSSAEQNPNHSSD